MRHERGHNRHRICSHCAKAHHESEMLQNSDGNWYCDVQCLHHRKELTDDQATILDFVRRTRARHEHG